MKTVDELKDLVDQRYRDRQDIEVKLGNRERVNTQVMSQQVLALFEVFYEEMFELQRQITNLEAKK